MGLAPTHEAAQVEIVGGELGIAMVGDEEQDCDCSYK
jgi:hypothetical protein